MRKSPDQRATRSFGYAQDDSKQKAASTNPKKEGDLLSKDKHPIIARYSPYRHPEQRRRIGLGILGGALSMRKSPDRRTTRFFDFAQNDGTGDASKQAKGDKHEHKERGRLTRLRSIFPHPSLSVILSNVEGSGLVFWVAHYP
jgi:hypothetical protein